MKILLIQITCIYLIFHIISMEILFDLVTQMRYEKGEEIDRKEKMLITWFAPVMMIMLVMMRIGDKN